MHHGSDWDQLRRRLETMTKDVIDEIGAYPRPITACDAQFNHLLELRRVLPQELQRLAAAAQDPSATVESFVRSSPCESELAAMAQA